jgi:hypothetical protein
MLFKIVIFCYHNFMFELKIYMHGITNSINSVIIMKSSLTYSGIYTIRYG